MILIDGITVPGVCREMGLEPDKRTMWSVGALVRNRYLEIFRRLPPKDLRWKTHAAGVHCFAIYPETFRPVIETALRDAHAAVAAQLVFDL